MVRYVFFCNYSMFEFGRYHDGGRCGDGEPTDLPTVVTIEFLGIDIQRDETESIRYGGVV